MGIILDQIWATIIQYYLGSIADGADRRNLRWPEFLLIGITRDIYGNDVSRLKIAGEITSKNVMMSKRCRNIINLNSCTPPTILTQVQSWISIRLMLTFFIRFVIFWHAQNLKNIPFKIVALEIKWIWYFSMNLWKKLFITNNFLYLLIEKIYGWTTIPNNTGW